MLRAFYEFCLIRTSGLLRALEGAAQNQEFGVIASLSGAVPKPSG